MAIKASYVISGVCVFALLSLLLPYAIAVSRGHVKSLLPYVGYCGELPPESMIYTELFAITSGLVMLVVQIRFVQVYHYFTVHHVSGLFSTSNDVSVAVGYVSAFGLLIGACFQESNSIFMHHLGSLVLFFGGSSIYVSLQALVSRRMKSLNNTDKLASFRTVLAIAILANFAIYSVGSVIALRAFVKPWNERLHWGPEDGGWKSHRASAVAEWTLSLLLNLYIGSFYIELKNVYIDVNRILVIIQERSSQLEISDTGTENSEGRRSIGVRWSTSCSATAKKPLS